MREARPPKPKPVNAIESSIRSWFQDLPVEFVKNINSTVEDLVATAPRRWVVYLPMVLLPSGSFSEDWWDKTGLKLEATDIAHYKEDLWRRILDDVSKREGKGSLTHLAINAGIPLNDEGGEEENIIRTPSGLIMLYGDFGPALHPEYRPTEEDFRAAFWVSTKQNGIVQVWAPRYTMFSRGNIKEKARLIEFHDSSISTKATAGATPGGRELASKRKRGREELSKKVAVDLYAGIGYFVFSYVKAGMKKVIGWELNPWSVEGLRRGAEANGWGVKVVKEVEDFGDLWENDYKIIIFLEDNKMAEQRLKNADLSDIMHVNCGLLPRSDGCWKMAFQLVQGEGWLHLHENIGANDVKQRRTEVEKLFQRWTKEGSDDHNAEVEHVEYVKTFAPDVWHCVLDLYINNPICVNK